MAIKNAAQLHRELRKTLQDLQKVEHRAVLIFTQIHEKRLYRELGYSSMLQYSKDGLKLSRTRYYQFLRLSDSLKKLPNLKKAIQDGDLPWTKARVLVDVATSRSEKQWIKTAKSHSRRELEDKVLRVKKRRHNSKNQRSLFAAPTTSELEEKPVQVSLRFDPMDFTRFESVVEKLRKQGRGQSREVLILAGLDALSRSKSPRGDFSNPYQIVLYECENCRSLGFKTQRGEQKLPQHLADSARCDARILHQNGSNPSTMTPAKRLRILARDEHRCQVPGCENTRFLEVHHLEERHAGGDNSDDNLITLCSACHQLLHRKGGLGALLAAGSADV